MRGRLASLLVAAVVLAGGGHPARASGTWTSVTVRRHAGARTAVLTYHARPVAAIGAQGVRDARLVVRDSGRIVLDAPIRTGGAQALRLALVDVWGGDEPEALVTLSSCGNRCSVQLAIGLAYHGHGHVVRHDFGGAWPGAGAAWKVERHLGLPYVVSRDQRFFCEFSDCASATTPVEVFVVDTRGSRLVDVTRRRPDLVARDAQQLFRGYENEIRLKQYGTKTRPGYGPLGVLAPWCADEFVLGMPDVCRSTLTQAAAKGYLNAANGGTRRTVAALYSDLRLWGY